MDAELTIVIPAKNEVKMLPKLLKSLCRQDYEGMAQTRVIVADAGSTDGTVEAALGFRDRLRVEVIAGWAAFGGKECGSAAGDDAVMCCFWMRMWSCRSRRCCGGRCGGCGGESCIW